MNEELSQIEKQCLGIYSRLRTHILCDINNDNIILDDWLYKNVKIIDYMDDNFTVDLCDDLTYNILGIVIQHDKNKVVVMMNGKLIILHDEEKYFEIGEIYTPTSNGKWSPCTQASNMYCITRGIFRLKIIYRTFDEKVVGLII